jgi:hypothetical protein
MRTDEPFVDEQLVPPSECAGDEHRWQIGGTFHRSIRPLFFRAAAARRRTRFHFCSILLPAPLERHR